MRVLPPVVMLITTSVCSRMRGTIMSKTAGSGVGRPSCGSRACRCTMAAPAFAASTAFCTIWSGVSGRYSDIEGVCTAPVTAQVMMTLDERFGDAIACLLDVLGRAGASGEQVVEPHDVAEVGYAAGMLCLEHELHHLV